MSKEHSKRLSIEIGEEVRHDLKKLFPVHGDLSKRIRDLLDDLIIEEKLKDEIRGTDA